MSTGSELQDVDDWFIKHLLGGIFHHLVELEPSPESKLVEFILGTCVMFSFASLLIKLVLNFCIKIVGSLFDLLLCPYVSQFYDLC